MNYFSQWPELEFIRQDESRVKASEALEGKEYVIFFIGAPWHAGYRDFIPEMKKFYDRFRTEKNFEVILITRGDTEEEILSDFFNPEFGKKTFSLPCSPKMLAAREAKRRKEDALKLEGQTGEEGKGKKKVGGGPTAPSSSSSSTPVGEEGNKKMKATNTTNTSSSSRKNKEEEVVTEKEKEEAQTTSGISILSQMEPSSAITTGGGGGGKKLPQEKEGAIISVPRVGKHGNYLLLDPLHSHVVGTPILFFFRVFSYPGVIVCRNGVPVVNPPPTKVYALPPPREKPWQPAVVRPPLGERDEKGNLKFTPSILDARCRPDLCTIAGKWMLTKKDPEAENFPWDSADLAKGPLYFILFLFLLTILAGVMAAILARSPHLRLQVNSLIGYPLLDVPPTL